jgi:hypothetical protein
MAALAARFHREELVIVNTPLPLLLLLPLIPF